MHPLLSDTQVALQRVRELTHATPVLWCVFRYVYTFPHLQPEVCRYIPHAYTPFTIVASVLFFLLQDEA
jgi:hypothetical protein